MSPETRVVLEVMMGALNLALVVVAVALWRRGQQRLRPDAVRIWEDLTADLSERVSGLERGRQQDHVAIMRLQSDLATQRDYARSLAEYSRTLADRLRSLGQDVPKAPPPPPEVQTPLGGQPSKAVLLEALKTRFSIEEIDDLAFRLGIDPAELSGDTIGRRAQSLVRYLERRRRLPELAALCSELRPDWSPEGVS